MKVSNSEIQAFKQCRRKWWLQYVEGWGLAREEPTGPRAIGNQIHEALAAFYDPEPADPFQLLDTWRDRELGAWPDQETEILKDHDLARIMLEGYFEWLEEEGADEGLEVIGVEQALEVEVYPGVILMGKLDKRVRREHDGARMFLDHKTVQEFTTPTKTLHLDEQVLTYQLLERMLKGEDERTDGGIYNMIRKVKRTARAKPPFYARMEVRHNDEVLRTFYRRVFGELHEMSRTRERLEAGESPDIVAYPSPTRDCSWKCDFFAVCPLIDDPGAGAETVLEISFTRKDPYARYDVSSCTETEG